MPKQVGDENTTPALRDAMFQMAQQGFNNLVIAKTFGRTRRTVRRILKNYRTRGHHSDAPRSGRPRKIDERASRRIKRVLEVDRRHTLGDVTNLTRFVLGGPVAPRTVSRFLNRDL